MIIAQTASKLGIPPEAIEKDLWVTAILQTVFTLQYSDKMVFKGGTSLSKIWNRIERFSEDIDLTIDRSVFDFDGDLTIKQIKTLRKKSSTFVRDVLCSDLRMALDANGLSQWVVVEPEPDGEGDKTYPEPRKIFIKYDSLFESPVEYLKPVVMLEVGARSLIEPFERKKANSFVGIHFGIDTNVADVEIPTAVPQKTFVEKIFLLHELFSSGSSADVNRKSRHLYDVEKMMDSEFAQAVINDDDLWNIVRHHRDVFTHIKGIDYSVDVRDHVNLIPPEDVAPQWAEDYKYMQNSMIYGESLSFEQLIERIRVLQNRIRFRKN